MVDKVRILCIFPHSIPFKNMALSQRITALSKAHDLTLLTRKRSEFNEMITDAHPKLIRCPVGASKSFLDLMIYFVWTALWLIAQRSKQYDIVYTFHEQSMILGWLAKSIGRARLSVTDVLDEPDLGVNDATDVPWIEAALRRTVTKAKRIALTSSDGVITTGIDHSDPLPARLITKWNVKPQRLLAVPNGVDLSITKPQEGLPREGFVAVYVGWVTQKRGVDTLLEAFLEFASEVPEASLTLAGHSEKSDRQWLQRILDNSKHGERVKYVGTQPSEEIWRLISLSHVCLYPFSASHLDYVFPVKLFEYLALGRSVIATDLPAVRRIVTHELNGLLVKPGDPEGLKGALLRIHDDKELRLRFEGDARKSVEKFDWKDINGRVLSFIGSLL